MEITKSYYKAEDIAHIMDISIASAYRVIKKLNEELAKSGYLVISGRVSKNFFEAKTGYTNGGTKYASV